MSPATNPDYLAPSDVVQAPALQPCWPESQHQLPSISQRMQSPCHQNWGLPCLSQHQIWLRLAGSCQSHLEHRRLGLVCYANKVPTVVTLDVCTPRASQDMRHEETWRPWNQSAQSTSQSGQPGTMFAVMAQQSVGATTTHWCQQALTCLHMHLPLKAFHH